MRSIWDEIVELKPEGHTHKLSDISLEKIENLKLSDFEKTDTAGEIYSEVLGRTVWFCSDWRVARQIRRDNPGVICYTAKELKEIVRLNPSPESVQRINEAKEVFRDSTIREADTKVKHPEIREESV